MKIGETHSVWGSLDTVVSDARKGTLKCRMLTGTYIIQITCHKFSRVDVSSAHNCRGVFDEDLAHKLLESPALTHQRKPLYLVIKTKVIYCIGAQKWKETHIRLLTLFKHKRKAIISRNTECNYRPKLHT